MAEQLCTVKEQLGHSSIQITVDTYGHLVPGGNRSEVDRLDDPVPATIRNLSATTLQKAEGEEGKIAVKSYSEEYTGMDYAPTAYRSAPVLGSAP
jgi:hypothetical protein